jgi:hypothetical protein
MDLRSDPSAATAARCILMKTRGLVLNRGNYSGEMRDARPKHALCARADQTKCTSVLRSGEAARAPIGHKQTNNTDGIRGRHVTLAERGASIYPGRY